MLQLVSLALSAHILTGYWRGTLLLFEWLLDQSNQTLCCSFPREFLYLRTLHRIHSSFKYLNQRLFMAVFWKWPRNVFFQIHIFIYLKILCIKIYFYKKTQESGIFPISNSTRFLFLKAWLKILLLINLYFCNFLLLDYNLSSFSLSIS